MPQEAEVSAHKATRGDQVAKESSWKKATDVAATRPEAPHCGASAQGTAVTHGVKEIGRGTSPTSTLSLLASGTSKQGKPCARCQRVTRGAHFLGQRTVRRRERPSLYISKRRAWFRDYRLQFVSSSPLASHVYVRKDGRRDFPSCTTTLTSRFRAFSLTRLTGVGWGKRGRGGNDRRVFGKG